MPFLQAKFTDNVIFSKVNHVF